MNRYSLILALLLCAALPAAAQDSGVNIVNMGPALNGPFDDMMPVLTADGETLFFTTTRMSTTTYTADFYTSTKENGQWQPARPLGPPVNTDGVEFNCSISPDGYTMYYSAYVLDQGENTDIIVTHKKGSEWGMPEQLPAPVNTREYLEELPAISPDGRTLFFCSDRPGGYGKKDIWWTTKNTDGSWAEPKNLGPNVNTTEMELNTFIHTDGVSLYFVSYGHDSNMGKADIFLTRWNGAEWTKAENIGSPFNTTNDDFCFFIDASGTRGFLDSNRDGGFGGYDLYEFEVPERMRPNRTVYVRGKVLDAKTGKPVAASIKITDLATRQEVRAIATNSQDGRFLTALPLKTNYAAYAEAPGYLFSSQNFALKDEAQAQNYELVIQLQPIQAGSSITLANIFYELNKYEFKPESATELDKLVEFLKANPGTSIEIGGHTDNTGTPANNLALSQSRARAVVNYLTSKGIAATRLTPKGYGDTKPIAPNTTEAGRSQNRRTEFRILKNG